MLLHAGGDHRHAALQQGIRMSDRVANRPSDLVAALLVRRLGAARAATLMQFLRFGVVGTVGFVVDTAVLYAGLAVGLGLYSGRAVSYVAAATTTWALNRAWTFRGQGEGPVARQWALFLVVNLIGFACNYGTYAALVASVPVVAEAPVIGVAAGALAGMIGNFLLSRRYVFGAGKTAPPS
jgi:putative flippase GtrA